MKLPHMVSTKNDRCYQARHTSTHALKIPHPKPKIVRERFKFFTHPFHFKWKNTGNDKLKLLFQTFAYSHSNHLM